MSMLQLSRQGSTPMHPPEKNMKRALDELRAGRPIIVLDDADRENEGDFIMPAECITPEWVNLMITHGRGLVCVALTAKRLAQLELSPMVNNNSARLGTRFTQSLDLLEGTTTGISAFDRAATIRALADERFGATAFARPGHLFPIQAVDGGLLARPGHTEAAVDLARLAGFGEAGVLCEILNDDGTMARAGDLARIAQTLGLATITIREIIEYRCATERLVDELEDVALPTMHGDFRLRLFHSQIDREHHLAIIKGDIDGASDLLVRVHSSCLTGDVLGSCRCDCGGQLHAALEMIEEAGRGAVIYMRQEGRGIGLANKIKAYALQDRGRDTVEANEDLGFAADLRDYATAAQILRAIDVKSVQLLTNNPEKISGLEKYGIEVTRRLPLEISPSQQNDSYLRAKRDKLGHLLHLQREK